MSRRSSARWDAVEVAAENKRPTIKSDVWSMAMVVIEVATGQAPFSHLRSEYHVVDQVAKKTRPERPPGNIWISDDLWEIMSRCWSAKPSARPDIAEVLERLQEEDAAYVRSQDKKNTTKNLI